MKPLNEKTFVLTVIQLIASVDESLGEHLITIVVDETVQLIELVAVVVDVRLAVVGGETEKDFVYAAKRDGEIGGVG